MRSVRSIVVASAFIILTALDARAASGDDAELARSARARDHPARRARAEPGGRREPGARPGRRGAQPGGLAAARPRGQVRAVGRAARAPVRAQRGEHADAGRAPDVPRLGIARRARARGGRGRRRARRTPRARGARRSPPRCGARTRAYYGADQELRLHLEHVGLTSRILELARLNQRTGHGSLQDVLRLELELTRLHTDVARVERQQRSSRALLNALMDRPSDAPLGPPEDLSVTPTTDVAALDEQHRHEPARGGRRGAAACAAARRCSTARAGRRGSRHVMVGLDYWYMPMFPDFQHAYGAMVAINLPWLSGRRRDEEREAEQTVQAERHALESTKNTVRYELRDAAARVDSARQSFTIIDQDLLAQAKRSLEATQAGVRRRPGRRGRRCWTRSGPTCRCGSSGCARWRSWRRARRISNAPRGRWRWKEGRDERRRR